MSMFNSYKDSFQEKFAILRDASNPENSENSENTKDTNNSEQQELGAEDITKSMEETSHNVSQVISNTEFESYFKTPQNGLSIRARQRFLGLQ